MHAWARWAIAAVVLALSASVAPPARADFDNCATAEFREQFDRSARAEGREPTVAEREGAYLAQFDERLRTVEYDCVERLRVPVATRGGGRHIRIIHDRSADWIADGAAMAAFERGARSAAEAIGRLGGVDLEDVTLLLADDFPPRDGAEFSNIAALAEFTNDGECRVIFYLVGPVSLSEHAAWVTAHEIFHCVQAANLSPEQVSTGATGTGGGGDWWLEGSASWFAALAVPDMETMRGFLADFDDASPTTPLNRMAYEASVFFLWFGQDRSPPQVMLFLAGMAPSRAESAQRAAMMDALPQESWLKFAEDYLDDRIRHPHGGDLRLSPEEGEVWTWSATRTQSQPLEPFVLVRSKLQFECGHWRTNVTPAAAHHARGDSGDWSPLPSEIDTSEGRGGDFRFVAMHAAPSRATLNIVGTMESGCGDCMGVTTTDACLYGSWQLTGGGSIEWMRSQGVPITSANLENTTITFRRDGTFVTGAVEGRMTMETERSRADGQLSAQSGGRWSTREGVLNVCGDMQRLSGQVTVTRRRGGSGTMRVPGAPPGNMSQRYSCSATTFDSEIEMPGHPPMRSQYTRTSPPPPSE